MRKSKAASAFVAVIFLAASTAVLLPDGNGEEGERNLADSAQFAPVIDITGVPAAMTAGIPLTLLGTAVPNNATNQTILWSIKDAGTTGASISGNKLNAVGAGTVTVTASIEEAYQFTMVSAGDAHTAAIRSDGSLWAWGKNWEGQLGDGTIADRNIPVRIGTEYDWRYVSAGFGHTMAINADGELWVWGSNWKGQLGDGTHEQRTSPVPIGEGVWRSVSSGGWHTMAINTDGELWAWGDNQDGQLGIGHNEDRNTPQRVGTANDWISVSAGDLHTVAINANGELWAWGDNWNGQLGDGTNTGRHSPVLIGDDWISASAGGYHTAAINVNGELWTWGGNTFGQLGLGDSGGDTERNIPTKVESDEDWSHVSAGHRYTAAIKDNDSLWTWGSNFDGQLGDGTDEQRTLPVLTETDIWRSVSTGYSHTAAINTKGELWGWGSNVYGQLGLTDAYKTALTNMGETTDSPYFVVYEKDFIITVTAPVFTVTYNLNGGTGIVPTTYPKPEGEVFAVALTTNITSPSDKFFMNWNTLADNTGTTFDAGATVTMPSNAITLYAIWGDVTHTAVTESNEWVTKSSEGFTMTVSDFVPEDLSEVRVNGVTVDSSNYTVTSGSTVVTLSHEYLETLGTGTHNIDLIFNGGVASTSLAISAATDDDDDNGLPLTLIMIAVLSAMTVAGLILMRNK